MRAQTGILPSLVLVLISLALQQPDILSDATMRGGKFSAESAGAKWVKSRGPPLNLSCDNQLRLGIEFSSKRNRAMYCSVYSGAVST